MATAGVTSVEDRVISMGDGLAAIPERLLLAHARGEVLFIAGAGVSKPSNLPDFRGLVLQIYAELDAATYAVMNTIPNGACNLWGPDLLSLTNQQAAEVKRFVNGDYDVVLGMLERRLDGQGHGATSVRKTSLVIECLHALKEGREPAVPYARIQQMLRSLDGEVRAHGAQAIQRFVQDVSSNALNPHAPPPEGLFRAAAKPFLHRVWPQERSLATQGVSRALADLPATARGAFAEAVEAVERFLVPFECWSMLEYGLYGEKDDEPKLSMIDNSEKASAFLSLLDHTIGTTEGSVIPFDLGDALDQIRKVAPNLEGSQIFRRLATAARRA